MVSLEWFSLPNLTGSITGRGAVRSLGHPKMDPLTLVTREMAQNSWDARLPRVTPEFGCVVREASKSELGILREEIFGDGYEVHSKYSTSLGKTFREIHTYLLEYWDRGTTGLDGPERPDIVTEGEISQNFINLTSSLGSDEKEKSNGGSYGFGKTAAFAISRARSVIYWSAYRTSEGDIDYRLLAVAFGDSYSYNGKRYTGRHWWGRRSDTNGVILPLSGVKARVLGESLFTRHFSLNETGTSVLIVDVNPNDLVRIEEEDDIELNFDDSISIIDRAHKQLERIVMKNLWPKLDIDSGNDTSMNILINNRPILISELKNDLIYNGIDQLCASLRDVRRMSDVNVALPISDKFDGLAVYKPFVIKRKSPRKVLGYMQIARSAYYPTYKEAIFPPNTVCLMRSEAELVVQYLPINGADESKVTWRGVFKPDVNIDPAFRDAEPPAHDEWNSEGIRDRTYKNDVIYTMRKLRKIIREEFSIHEIKRDSGSLGSLAEISQSLAYLNPVVSVGGGVNISEPEDGMHGQKKENQSLNYKTQKSNLFIERAEPFGIDPKNNSYIKYKIFFSISGKVKPLQRIRVQIAVVTGEERVLTYEDDHLLNPVWSRGWIDCTPDTERRDTVSAICSQLEHPVGDEIQTVTVTLRKGRTYLFRLEG